MAECRKLRDRNEQMQEQRDRKSDMTERIVRPGEFYRHFKNKLYQIVAVARHSETGERMVVYQALYGDFKIWVRPLSMFMEEVDREKYPDADQDYRSERVTEPGCRMGDGQGIQAGEEPEEEKPMNPHLLEFFDAMDVRDYDKMLEALARLSQKAGQKEVDDICMVLDIRPQGDSAAEQISGIRQHVRMLKKFDGERLR